MTGKTSSGFLETRLSDTRKAIQKARRIRDERNHLLKFMLLLSAVSFIVHADGATVELGPVGSLPGIISSIGAGGDAATTIPFSFDTLGITTHPSPLAGYVYLQVEDLKPNGKPGTPAVPVKTFVLTLPGESEVTGARLVDGRFREIKNPLRIVPHPQPLIRKQETGNRKQRIEDYYTCDGRIYRQTTFYPGQVVSYQTGRDNEKTYCFIRLYPVHYLPDEKRTVILTEGRLEIQYRTKAVRIATVQAPKGVIICPPEFVDCAQALQIFHSTELGMVTTIVTTDWIGHQYQPASLPPYCGYSQYQSAIIKNYDFTLARKIISYLRDSDAHPELGPVIILGDAAKVPPSYYFLLNPNGINLPDYWAPSDLLYASPDYDFVPNVPVGRLSVSDTAEANRIIMKLVDWYPADWSWFQKAIVAGGDPFPNYFPYYDEALIDEAINQESFNGFAVTKFFRSDEQFTRTAVEADFATGNLGVFYETGHGSGDAILFDDGSELTADEVLAYPGGSALPLVMTPACNVGAFDTDLVPTLNFPTSFGEAVLKSKGGGIGFFGSTRIGITGLEYHLDQGRLTATQHQYGDALFLNSIKSYRNGAQDLGAIYEQSIFDFVNDNDMADTLNQWTVFSFVLLGDPALKLPPVVSGVSYHLPQSSVATPTYYNGNGYPVFQGAESDSIVVSSTSNSPTIRYKLCDATSSRLALDTKHDGSTPFSYSFNPIKNLPCYLVRAESEDGKEGWLYTFVTAGSIVADGDIKDWERAGLQPVAVDPADFNPPDFDIRRLYVTDDAEYRYLGFDLLASDSTDITYGIAIDCKPGGYTGSQGKTQDAFDNWLAFGPDHPVDYEIFIIASGLSLTQYLYSWEDTGWSRTIYPRDSGSFAGFDSILNFAELAVPKKLLPGSDTFFFSLFSCGYDYKNKERSPALDAAPSDPATYHDLYYGKVYANTITQFASVKATGIEERGKNLARGWQVSPNPFSHGAVITYQVPSPAAVALKVYDSSGRLVRRLAAGLKPAGVYTVRWDGTNDAGSTLAAGIYFYHLKIGENTVIKKAVLVQ